MNLRVPALGLLLALSLTSAYAQDQVAKPTAPVATAAANSASKRKSDSAGAKAKSEQRAMAMALLMTLAGDARSFKDQKLRARTLARVADSIWEQDPEQGRALFLRAWDAAEIADQESARLLREDRDRQQALGGPIVLVGAPNLLSEVLRLAAKRDRALGEELLEKLKQARAQQATDAAGRQSDGPVTPEAIRQRLSLARQLLDVDVPRALQFADPALGTVNMYGLNFLSFLREKDATGADQRYFRMLTVAENDPQSDANTVSLLSSYVFTPHLFLTFDRSGAVSTSQMGRTVPPATTPELRGAFFRVASQILMRPLASPEQDQTTSGIEGKFLIITRLMPLFEQYAPPQVTDMMRGQLAALNGSVREEIRKRDDEMMRRGIRDEEAASDSEQSLLDQIDRARTSEQRDQLYLDLIMRIAGKGDMRARDFADKIEDSELRKQAKPFVDMTLTIFFIDKKKPDEALKLSTSGELTHFQRVWALTQVAKQLSDTDREQAQSILTNAVDEARRIDKTDADRARALIGVANTLFPLDRNRSWELIGEAVSTANSAEDFTGEDSRLTLKLITPTISSIRTNSTEGFDVPALFHTITKDDYHRAVGLARTFEADSPRATALISIAQAVLSEKP
ncbi:MAG TPA: hypothetical protein VJT50_00020 [Pyrinomonadaceae bacterium]|nr:hypothetical protein [Pyrinomonadaceae bacterium]